MKGRLGLLVSLAAGIFALIAVFLYLKARENELIDMSNPVDVVVTTRNVLANTPLDERMIRKAQIPKRFVQPGAIALPAEVIGRVAAVPLLNGVQVTGTALLEGGRESLAFHIARGQRAITIAVNDITGVAGQARPGNVVDVVGIFEYGVPNGTQGGQITYSQERTEAVTILQAVSILAVSGGESAATAPVSPAEAVKGESSKNTTTTEATAVTNVTLLLSPAQVQELILAQHIGSLTLSLRNSLDTAPVELERLDENSFLKVPMPLKPKAQPTWREMRGSPRGY